MTSEEFIERLKIDKNYFENNYNSPFHSHFIGQLKGMKLMLEQVMEDLNGEILETKVIEKLKKYKEELER